MWKMLLKGYKIKQAVCDIVKRLVSRWRCCNGKHDWVLINSIYEYDGLYHRAVHFKCASCGKEHMECRVGCFADSGSMVHFFDREDWPFSKYEK